MRSNLLDESITRSLARLKGMSEDGAVAQVKARGGNMIIPVRPVDDVPVNLHIYQVSISTAAPGWKKVAQVPAGEWWKLYIVYVARTTGDGTFDALRLRDADPEYNSFTPFGVSTAAAAYYWPNTAGASPGTPLWIPGGFFLEAEVAVGTSGSGLVQFMFDRIRADGKVLDKYYAD